MPSVGDDGDAVGFSSAIQPDSVATAVLTKSLLQTQKPQATINFGKLLEIWFMCQAAGGRNMLHMLCTI